jgi:multidrug efflux pump subunit AcrA (membrane-fusion protein)
MAGSVVMRVVTPGKMKLEIPLSEAQAFWVQPGLKAKVTPAAFPQTSYEGTCGTVLAAMAKGGAPGVGFTLPIALPDVDPRLLPGMKVSVKIEAGKVEEALLVPLSAVSAGSVQVKGKDGKGEARAVVLGRSDGTSVEVKEGLREGDEVMLGGKK